MVCKDLARPPMPKKKWAYHKLCSVRNAWPANRREQKSKRVAEGNNPAIFLPPVSARGGYLDGSRAGVVARPLTKALDSPEKTPLFRNEKECFTMRYRASQTRGCCSHATTFTAWGINLFIFDVLLRCCDLFGRLNHYWLLTGNRGGM